MAKRGRKTEELPKGLQNALADRQNATDSAAFLSDMIDIWGGPRALAQDVYTEYKAAHEGSMTRQRLLEMLSRLIQNTTSLGMSQVTRPSDMSDEDLERIALAYTKRVTQPLVGGAGCAADSVSKKEGRDGLPTANPGA